MTSARRVSSVRATQGKQGQTKMTTCACVSVQHEYALHINELRPAKRSPLPVLYFRFRICAPPKTRSAAMSKTPLACAARNLSLAIEYVVLDQDTLRAGLIPQSSEAAPLRISNIFAGPGRKLENNNKQQTTKNALVTNWA